MKMTLKFTNFNEINVNYGQNVLKNNWKYKI